ncbi:MAG: hypothetical protein EOP88_19790 [Verrucomicrobiaceae bacterium]|nr:MAG: hypothetical protein EOP88_19790 [Verrucomicrobiaceae bacterium]
MKKSLLYLAVSMMAGPVHAGVFAHYSFDSDLSDSSPNHRHGTLVDVGTLGNSGITSAADSFKFGGGAMNFSAERDQVTIPLQSFASGRPYTIAFWAKKEAGDTGNLAQWDMVIGQRGTTNFFIGLGDTGNATAFRWRSAGTSTDRQADFAVPKDHLWHHYALVASGETITLYLDGQLFGTSAGKKTGFAFDTIGDAYNNSANYALHGQLDELWILDEALDAAGVSKLYLENNPGIPQATVTRLRVYLLGGQSNADGRADAAGLPAELQLPQPDVDFYYRIEGSLGTLTTLRPGLSESLQFGPEIIIGKRLAKLHSDEDGTRVAIIKYANGGTNLHTQWKAGGDATTTGDGAEYVVFQQTVTAGLAALAAAYPGAQVDLQAMVWMQGESDADATNAPLYQNNLTAFISDVRATYGQTLPFVIGRLSSSQTNLAAQHLNTIRAAQDAVAAADPLTGIVSTDGLAMNPDALHFSAAGQQEMGSRFAGEAAYFAWAVDTFSPEDIAAGLAEPDADRDGDGQSNRAEFISGSSPLSATSQYRAWFSMDGPGEGNISYETARTRTYVVEKFSEATATWATELPAAGGSGDTVSRPVDASLPVGIYRVRVDLP